MKTYFTYILIVVLFYPIQQLHSQFAIVTDSDGYCNVRDTPSKSGTVLERIESGSMIFCIESENLHWKNLDLYDAATNIKQSGYIYRNRIVFVEDYLKIPVIKADTSSLILGNNDIKIMISSSNFDPKSHKLNYNAINKDFLDRIDDKYIWGTDGNIPKKQYDTFTILLKNKKITLPKKALENVYEPNFESTFANYDAVNDILYIYAFNSDGAGGYGVMWKIEKGIYKDRIVRFTS